MDESEIANLYKVRQTRKKMLQENLQKKTNEIALLNFKGFVRLICAVQSTGPVAFDFSKLDSLVSKLGSKCLYPRGGTERYHNDGYYSENEHGRTGVTEDEWVLLNIPLILKPEHQRDMIPSFILVSWLYHFLKALPAIYQSVAYFWLLCRKMTPCISY